MNHEIRTVEELEALPEGSIVMLLGGTTWDVFTKNSDAGWNDYDGGPERRWMGIGADGVPVTSVTLLAEREGATYALLGQTNIPT